MTVYEFDQFSTDEDSKHHYIKRGKTAVYWGHPRRNPHGAIATAQRTTKRRSLKRKTQITMKIIKSTSRL